MVLAFAGLLARVVQIKVSPDPRLAAATGSPFSSRPEMTRRGDLLDRRGRTVATSTVGHRLFIDPQEVERLDTVAVDLAAILGLDDPTEIDRAIVQRADRRYVVIDHLLDDWQVEAVHRANLRGVGLQRRLVRGYPSDPLAANIVGLVGFEHTGLSGMEHAMDALLEPEPGRLTYLRDAQRRPLWIDLDGHVAGDDGLDVRLSIDLVIQDIAEQRLKQAIDEYNAGGGRVVAIDPRTGEILALVDMLRDRPGFEAFTADPLRDKHPSYGRNRCVTDPYEPGSTFKPFVWSIATEQNIADLDEVIPTPETGWINPAGTSRTIRDAFAFPDATWRQVLIKSLNTGMAIVGERMSPELMQEVVRRFGFGRRTECGLPGESPGIVTSPQDWSRYTQQSVAMGHEIAVTPVQMVRAFSAFARDGTLPDLRLTAVSDVERGYRIVHRVLPADVARTTRETMRHVMTEGTGRRAQSAYYELFGKSGTAQLPDRTNGGYHQDRYIANFIAGAPLHDPRIVVLCVVDDPDKHKGHYGGVVAAPVVRDIIDQSLLYLGVPTRPAERDDAPAPRDIQSHPPL